MQNDETASVLISSCACARGLSMYIITVITTRGATSHVTSALLHKHTTTDTKRKYSKYKKILQVGRSQDPPAQPSKCKKLQYLRT